MVLFIHATGPLVRYTGDLIEVDNLNPATSTRWRMSRIEMLRFGWRCIIAALRGA